MITKKQIKIIISFCALILAIILIVNFRIIKIGEKTNIAPSISEPKNSKNTSAKIEHILSAEEIENLKVEYSEEFTAVAHEYEIILSDSENSANAEELSQLRERMLALIIPEEYKKIHIELVLKISEINNLLNSSQKDITKATALLNEAKTQFYAFEKSS